MRVDYAFAASLDADSEGGEGRFYVWRPDEVGAVLGADAGAEFCAAYDITDAGNFEGASIPNRLNRIALQSDAEERRLAEMRAALLAVRDRRPRPARDDKILADWNGLLIAALAGAGVALDCPEWIEAAKEAYRFITETMMVNERLRHSFRDGRLLLVGFAGDYAAMMKAAIALDQATLAGRYLSDARGFAATLDRHYWDAHAAAYRMTADDADRLIMRPLPLFDDAAASANATIAAALARLASLTGQATYAERADLILAAHGGGARSVLGKAGLFNALDQRLHGTDIVLITPQPALADNGLLLAIRADWRDGFTLLVRTAGDGLPTSHPAYGKTPKDGRPTAYVCRGQTCSAPVTDAGALRSLLGAVTSPSPG
jgi:hypothetical protein